MDLKKLIIKHLKHKGNYDPDVDDYVIDMLIENINYSELMKQEIYQNGLVQTITAGNGAHYTKQNPAFGIYQMCLRNIHQCSAKLGINRNDRLKLKMLEEKTKDDFDNDFV